MLLSILSLSQSYFWPCNFETLCFCNSVAEGAPRVPPAPKTRLPINETLDPCRDVLTQETFDAIVQPQSFEGQALYSYEGLCSAIRQYNTFHDEKFANMGTEEQVRGLYRRVLILIAASADCCVGTRGIYASFFNFGYSCDRHARRNSVRHALQKTQLEADWGENDYDDRQHDNEAGHLCLHIVIWVCVSIEANTSPFSFSGDSYSAS